MFLAGSAFSADREQLIAVEIKDQTISDAVFARLPSNAQWAYTLNPKGFMAEVAKQSTGGSAFLSANDASDIATTVLKNGMANGAKNFVYGLVLVGVNVGLTALYGQIPAPFVNDALYAVQIGFNGAVFSKMMN
jgi:hypothetical protein